MKYKKLIVAGCSYTENSGGWAYQLAAAYNLELINLAARGAGNKHILISLLSYLAKNKIDTEDTLVGIMWSHPIRDDVIIEQNINYKDQTVYGYKYDQFNCRVGMDSILNKLDTDSRLVKAEVYKSILFANYNKAAMTLVTWTYIESVIAYLSNNNYTFFQTIFLDYLNRSTLIKKNTDSIIQQSYSYHDELERINLKQNNDGWVNLKHHEYLGEYAFYTNNLAPDKMHPNVDCAKHWTNKILIPKLKEMKILDT